MNSLKRWAAYASNDTRCDYVARFWRWVNGVMLVIAVSSTIAYAQQTNLAVVVRHAPNLNGSGLIEGSVQQLLGESITLNGGFTLTGDLFVPGTPTLKVNGNPTFAGTIIGSGSASPTGYQVALNGNCSLQCLRTRTTPVLLPTVATPPQPFGTRSVTINSSGQLIGDPVTLRNLTLNGNVGQYAIPPGTYGNFIANGGSGFTLGTAGATNPAIYNLQNLALNGQSRLEVVSPVILAVANGFTANGVLGSTNNPSYLQLQIASGGFTLNGGGTVHGNVTAPAGTVIINGNSLLVGMAQSDRLIVNSGGIVRAGTTVNQPPVANAQNASVAEDGTLNVTLTANDPEGATLIYSVLNQPGHGVLTGTVPNLDYTPAANFNGADSFTFKVNDGQADSATATIAITVTPLNDAPVAQSQNVSTPEDTALTIALSGSDVENSPLTFIVVTFPAHGSLTGTAPNLAYTPATDYSGPDSFTYQASDGELNSTTATVSIAVNPVDDAPVAANQTVTTDEDMTADVTLTAVDVEGDGLDFTVLTQPAHGTLSGTPPNLLYTPATNYHGNDSFTFQASDAWLNSVPATVTLIVRPLNDVPVPTPQTITTPEDTATNLVLTATDVDGDTVSFNLVASPANGTLNGTSPELVFSPAADFTGTNTFFFVAVDGNSTSAPVAITLIITSVHDAPVAEAKTLTLNEDTTATVTLGGTDADGDTLTFTVLTQPTNGVLSGVAPDLVYVPNTNFNGVDNFTYVANDGTTNSTPTLVGLIIQAVNDLPAVKAGPTIVVGAMSAVLSGSVTDADIPYGGWVTSYWSQASGLGLVTFGNASDPVTTATFAQPGIYSLRLSAGDGQSVASDEVTVYVNAPPIVSAGTNQNIAFSSPAILNGQVSDDGIPLGQPVVVQWSVVSGPGTVAFDSLTSASTTAAFSVSGTYVLRLTAGDSLAIGSSDVTIVVRPVNFPPACHAGFDQVAIFPNDVLLNGVVTDDGEPTGNPVSVVWSKVSGPALADFDQPNQPSTAASFTAAGVYLLRLTATDSELSASDEVQIIIHHAPLVDAGTNAAVVLGGSFTLYGSVTDDGLPYGITNMAWSQVSGPGATLFSSAGSPLTAASFTAPGYYTLRLTATDSNAVVSDDVIVAVRPDGENMAPYVIAGTNQFIGLTNRAELAGVVTDDGLPFGAPVTSFWSVISGPGEVLFESATNPASAAAFSVAGVYALRLTVTDSELTSSSDVTISVYPDNQPPMVDAGPDQTVASGPVLLGATHTDDGRPANVTPSNWWAVVSGPGQVMIANSNSPVTTADFSIAGVYTLRFSVNDGQFVSSDDVVVTLTGNQSPMVDAGGNQLLDLFVADGAVTSSITTYPPVVDGWKYGASQPGLAGSYGNIGTVGVNRQALAWSGYDLCVGGAFLNANGQQVRSLTRWNGCFYSPVYDSSPSDPNNPASPPVGFISGSNSVATAVFPIAARGSHIFISGGFLSSDLNRDGHLDFIAWWNGTRWLPWQPRFVNSVVARHAMISSPDAVYFGGNFRYQPGTNYGFNATTSLPGVITCFNVAKWDGTNWVALNEGVRGINSQTNWSGANTATVFALALAPNGELYAGGRFVMETPSGFATNLVRWDGTNWNPVGLVGFNNDVNAIAVSPNGDLYVAGSFTAVGGLSANRIARWDGSNWSPSGVGFNNTVNALVFHDDVLVAGGGFSQAGGSTANRIARWNGTNWSTFPGGGLNSTVNALASTPHGLYIGGNLTMAGGVTANNLVLWGHDMFATLEGPLPIVVSNAPSGGATVPVTVQVSHPCASELTLSWNVNGGSMEHVQTIPQGLAGDPLPVSWTNHFEPGINSLVVLLSSGTNPPITFSTTVTVLTPAVTTLNGIVSDDGLPANSLVATWSQLSGPNQAVISQPVFTNAPPVTSAAFTAVGTYVFELAGDDSEFVTTDLTTITVRGIGNSNRPPSVGAGTDQFIALDEAAVLQGVALDDGLPGNQLILNWQLQSGPGTVAFEPAAVTNTQFFTTAATFSAPGDYLLRLIGDDSEFVAFDDVQVTVGAETNTPPVVDAGSDRTALLNASVRLDSSVTDDGRPFGSLNSFWESVSGPGGVLFRTANGITYANFGTPGNYVLRLTANDGRLHSYADVGVTVLSNAPGPLVEITAPLDGTTITAPVPIFGSVVSDILTDYRIEYRLAPPDSLSTSGGKGQGEMVWSVLSSNTISVVSNTLAIFDPTLLLNGIYELRLTATDLAGRSTATEPVTVIVDRNLKIGHFTASFNDLAVPVPGLPLQIVRTYDSRAASAGIQGDFGIGWTLDIRNVRLQKNRPLSRNWEQITTGSPWDLSLVYHLDPGKPRIVTITFPDGRVEKFQFVPNPMDQALLPIEYPQWRFIPLGNTRGSLMPAGYDDPDGRFLYFAGSIPGTADLYDLNYFTDWFSSSATLEDLQRYPTLFRYTTPEGYKYLIDEIAGMQSVTDPNGNTLLIGTNGVTWTNSLAGTNSLSLAFQRDSLGRITNIVDAAGHAMAYTYNVAGDLVTYIDRVGQTNGFDYTNTTFPHHLTGIIDARGITPVRNEYDANGRLVGNIDAFGNAISYGHDFANSREYITNRLGHVTISEYDEHGNVTRVIDPLGGETLSDYDANGNLLITVDPLGRTNSYTYDTVDNRLTATDPLGNTTRFTYGAQRRVTSVTDPRGNSITNVFDARGNLLSMRDPLGNVTRFGYDAQGLPVAMTNTLGQVMRFAYDAKGRLTNEVDALSHATSYQRDANGNLLTQTTTRTTSNGVETLAVQFQYDVQSRLTNSIFPDGSSARTIYNTIGKPALTIDQQGRSTVIEYDELGRVARTTYPDGSVEPGGGYDAEGRRIAATNRLGQVTRYEYDANGRLFRTVMPDGASTTNWFDLAGQLLVSSDARGNYTFYGYDMAGRSVAVTNALGEVSLSFCDAAGNVTNAVDALGQSTRFVYDQLNRRVQTVFADGTTQTTWFDALGRRTHEQDQAGKVTAFGYDTLGRMTAVTNALGYVTSYAYDELGQQLSQTDANNHTTTFEYDSLGRRVKRTLPGGQVETYVYNIGGLLTNKTDFNGYVTTYQYDVMNRLLAKIPDSRRSEPSVTYGYDVLGLRTNMTDASGATFYAYDNRNRLAAKTKLWGSADASSAQLSATLNYGYDANGSLTNILSSSTNGVNVSYEYDALNRLSAVNDASVGRTVYTYDSIGNLKGYTYPNLVHTEYTYDALNRLTNLASARGFTAIANYAYAVGSAGNRTNAVEQLFSSVLNAQPKTINRIYTYDNVYRLTGETINGTTTVGSLGYGYDPVGNRLSRGVTSLPLAPQTFGFDANDRLNTDSYDANGNTLLGAGFSQFQPDQYDFENRLVSRVATVNGQATTINIWYDGDGNRVKKSVVTPTNSVTTFFVVDELNPSGYAQVLEELSILNPPSSIIAVTKVYTYGHTLISQDQLDGSQWLTSFYGYDGHNNVRYLTDLNGNVTDTYDYDAFGNLIAQDSNSQFPTPNSYLFTGEQYDTDLGLYYLRARYHNPDTGRFWMQDSFEGFGSDPTSLHKYTYCGNNPVNCYDPSGRYSIAEMSISSGLWSGVRTFGSAMLGASFGGIAGGLDSIAHGRVSNAELASAIRSGASAGFDAGLMFGALGAIGGPAAAFGSVMLGTLYLGPGFYGVIEDLQAGDFEGADFRSRMTVAGGILTAYSLKGSLTSYYNARTGITRPRPDLKASPSTARDWLYVSAGGLSPLRVRVGRTDRVAVIGRSMPAIRAYQSELASRGIVVETFDGPRIPVAAMNEWSRLTAGGRRLTPSEVMKTQLFRENANWATKLAQDDYTVVDLGNPRNQSQSIFYDTETSQLFGQ